MNTKKHGMFGKRNAAKKSADKITVDRVEIVVPRGWKAKARAAAAEAGVGLSEWIRLRCGL
jgi:hypothetical protein